MIRYDCETVRDLLPALLRNELLPHEAAQAESHLAGCVECTADAGVVRMIQATQAPVPPGLEARVLRAVRRPQPVRHFTPARWAMAATVAAAVLGGSWIMERSGFGTRPMVPAELDASFATVLSWAAAEDPLLHGTSALELLSIEELELLLEELDS